MDPWVKLVFFYWPFQGESSVTVCFVIICSSSLLFLVPLEGCASWLTHCNRETPKRVFGKQWRPRSDAAECGVWSGSPLFANSSTIFLRKSKSHSLTYLKSKLESSNKCGRVHSAYDGLRHFLGILTHFHFPFPDIFTYIFIIHTESPNRMRICLPQLECHFLLLITHGGSYPYGVMSTVVSLSNPTFTGRTSSSKQLTSIVCILSPDTDNCPSWIRGWEWP